MADFKGGKLIAVIGDEVDTVLLRILAALYSPQARRMIFRAKPGSTDIIYTSFVSRSRRTRAQDFY